MPLLIPAGVLSAAPAGSGSNELVVTVTVVSRVSAELPRRRRAPAATLDNQQSGTGSRILGGDIDFIPPTDGWNITAVRELSWAFGSRSDASCRTATASTGPDSITITCIVTVP
ncbi:MAG: hypothetical protein JO041_03435 [Acidobacteria bacterium]|nr:hypothetical protein [Acidobacteriota bacterium]